MPDADTCLDYESATKLPLLNATVKELVRFHVAVPGPLPRYVPSGDGFVAEGKYVLPPGTEVALQAYTIHRNRDIFGEDAELFNPDRWLVSLLRTAWTVKIVIDILSFSTARSRSGRGYVQECRCHTVFRRLSVATDAGPFLDLHVWLRWPTVHWLRARLACFDIGISKYRPKL